MDLSVDDVSRFPELKRTIENNPYLRSFYRDRYETFSECLSRCPREGTALELGSGAGFVKEVIPEIVTSDTLQYPGLDMRVDALNMPFESDSLRFVGMINVFHHVPDVNAMFHEWTRCVKKGGRVLIADQNRGWISRPILKYLHHEPYDDRTTRWGFETTGPLSGANGALAWMVFVRDRVRFESEFPQFKIVSVRTHTPFQYWVSGGLKRGPIVPKKWVPAVHAIDRWVARGIPQMGSFVDIELLRC